MERYLALSGHGARSAGHLVSGIATLPISHLSLVVLIPLVAAHLHTHIYPQHIGIRFESFEFPFLPTFTPLVSPSFTVIRHILSLYLFNTPLLSLFAPVRTPAR